MVDQLWTGCIMFTSLSLTHLGIWRPSRRSSVDCVDALPRRAGSRSKDPQQKVHCWAANRRCTRLQYPCFSGGIWDQDMNTARTAAAEFFQGWFKANSPKFSYFSLNVGVLAIASLQVRNWATGSSSDSWSVSSWWPITWASTPVPGKPGTSQLSRRWGCAKLHNNHSYQIA